MKHMPVKELEPSEVKAILIDLHRASDKMFLLKMAIETSPLPEADRLKLCDLIEEAGNSIANAAIYFA